MSRDNKYSPFLLKLHSQEAKKAKPSFSGRKKKITDEEKQANQDRINAMKSRMKS